MKMNEMYPSKYLKAADIPQGKKVTVIIKSVVMEALGDEEHKETKPVVYFDGKEKGLVCNKTNASTIAELYGQDTEDWIGKPISLQVMEVAFKGKQTLALRVSLVKPVMSKPTATKSAPEKSEDDINMEMASEDEAF